MIHPWFETHARRYGFGFGVQTTTEVEERLTADGRAAAERWLAEPELAAFDALSIQKRRIEWLAGRLAAKRAFAHFARTPWPGTRSGPVVSSGPSRAPFLVEYPCLRISISHAHAYAVAVVRSFAVGVDLEKVETRPRGLARLCCSARELAELWRQADAPEDFDDQMTKFWSRKEAVSKYLQLGGQMNFADLDTTGDLISTDDPGVGRIRLLSGRLGDYWLSVAL